MDFYTDVSIYKNQILLRGYYKGKRIQKEIKYKPYLFYPTTDETPFRSVDEIPLGKKKFDSIWDAKKFLQTYEKIDNYQIYGMDRFVYPFIFDNYSGTINYDTSKIKVMYLDIEVDSEDGYPNIDIADKHITAITYRIGNTRTVLGLKDFDKNKLERIKDIDNIHYYQFDNEKDLLTSFITLWKAADIDVVTGWNIELFDIPYIIRRIRQVLGEDDANSISPWDRLIERTIISRGKEHIVYFPVGIAILDYIQLYKKFTYTQRESYALNYIAHVELKVKKMDYSDYTNLADLYKKNHQLFIEYNIIDVDLVYQLEDKLRLIELVYAMAYDAKVNFNDTLGSVLLWDVLIMNYLMEKNIVVSPKKKKNSVSFEGGYVKDPILGMHKWVVSFDLTSLYPHLIMQYNISPETHRGRTKIPSIQSILNGEPVPHIDGCVLAVNGSYYTKDKTGFLSALMASQFNMRNEYKKKMIEVKKEYSETKNPELEKEISRLHNAQLAKKIQLNSAYGALGNEWFRWYDPEHAEAITLSGQLSIRWIGDKVNTYVQKMMKDDNDYIIAIDTDSIYVNFGPVIEKIKPNDPVAFLDKLGREMLEPYMKEQYEELAKMMNANSNKMFMKREAIADKAIWRAKKNYIANVWDNEGVRFKEPELKMMGIEAVRSSTPELCRQKIKEAIKLIVTHDEETVQQFIAKFKEEYMKLPFEEIAFPRGVKNLVKYSNKTTIYSTRTPIHVRASLLYNKKLEELGLINKYSIIYESDKIKYCYLKLPNPIYEDVIGSPNILPKEFELDKYIDYDLMFSKSFLEPVKSLLDVIGWEPVKTASIMSFFQ